MKITVLASLAASIAVAFSSQAEGLEDVRPSSIARRHHTKAAKMQQISKRSFEGTATWYGFNRGALGACGEALDPEDHIVALNQGQYGSLNSKSSYCGKTITITNGIKTTTAKIMDACPKTTQCHHGALDMSRSLFSYFEDFGVGVFPITWWVNGEGDDSSSKSSSSSSSSSSASKSSSTSNKSDDDKKERLAQQKKKEKEEEEKKEKAAKKAAAKKKEEEEEKEAAEKKKEAAKKKEEKKKEAAKKKKEEEEKKKKEAQEKVEKEQSQNIASFGEIMETLNDMVEQAMDSSSSGTAATSS